MLAAEDDAETTLDDDKEARAIPERDRQAEHDEDERRVFDAIREGCHRRRGYAIRQEPYDGMNYLRLGVIARDAQNDAEQHQFQTQDGEQAHDAGVGEQPRQVPAPVVVELEPDGFEQGSASLRH